MNVDVGFSDQTKIWIVLIISNCFRSEAVDTTGPSSMYYNAQNKEPNPPGYQTQDIKRMRF